MIAKSITYFGQPCILCCDANCKKAWGINGRPKVYLVGEDKDPDDYAYLADSELGEAPDYPGTWEGGEGKPLSPATRLNKWCARECERSKIADPNTDFELPDFSERLYNYPPRYRKETSE